MATLFVLRQPGTRLGLTCRKPGHSAHVLRQTFQCSASGGRRRHYSKSTGGFSGGRDVRILEVGPRDGLQNIKDVIPTATKLELIQRLAATGLRDIEATSFVSPRWVPQLADGAEIMRAIQPLAEDGERRFPVLAPNPKGLENAMKSNAKEVVIFASASEAFSKANQNCTVDQALAQAETVAIKAREHSILVRGVVSCIFADPYTGPTQPQQVEYVAKRLLDMGCYEVSLGDTLGVGTPYHTQKLLEYLLARHPGHLLAGHFHDTYGQAVANVVKAYDMGLRTFDSSVAGLGGCPYAVGARGNLATEDVVYLFDQMGLNTGVNLDKLVETGEWISRQLGRPNGSRAGAALSAKARAGAQPAPSPAAKSTSVRRSWTTIEDNGNYRVARAGPVVKVTLTRDRNGNALTGEMVDGLTRLYRGLAQDHTVFHIVLASEGRFFCTGMDLSGGTDTSDTSQENSYYHRVYDLFQAIEESPQTTVAVVDGPCYAGGVGLSTVCDIRLASSRARWTVSEIKLGLVPAIISKFVVREWGPSFAREAILSGREVHAAELHRIGAVHGLAPSSDELEEMLETYLDRLRRAGPRAATSCKDLVKAAWAHPFSDTQERLIQTKFAQMMLPGSEGRHGIAQFQSKVKGGVDWVKFWGTKEDDAQ
ncbi:hypothetical protein CLAIMM_13222 [Cladophialophora immunda]|nr:hypothetical protein CLAIMM_13222 [Cladophialophora immunda]